MKATSVCFVIAACVMFMCAPKPEGYYATGFAMMLAIWAARFNPNPAPIPPEVFDFDWDATVTEEDDCRVTTYS